MLRDSSVAFMIIFTLLALFVIFIYEADGYTGPNIPKNQNYYVTSICSLTDEAPFYDCNERWLIYMVNAYDVYEHCYHQKSFHIVVLGCAMIDEYEKKGYWMVVGTGYNETSHTGQSVFEHELLHLRCGCNFHSGNDKFSYR